MPRNPATPRRLIWIIGLTVAIPMLYIFGCREVSRWYKASMMDAIYKNEHSMALEFADKALKWHPTDLELFNRKAGIYMDIADAKNAAATADQALLLARVNYEGRPTKFNQLQLAYALNASAYAHALDETKLEQSLELVEEAIAMFPIAPGVILDTRGYLHYLIGNFELALEDMLAAVELEEKNYRQQQMKLRSQSRDFVDQAKFAHARAELKESLATLFYHRGLAYEKMEYQKEADADFKKARAMGYDPDKGAQ